MKFIVLVCKKNYWNKILIKIFNFYIKKNKKIIYNNLEKNINKIQKRKKIYYLLNFSEHIFSEKILKNVKYPINFHPGSSYFPGRGCYSWALFKEFKFYGTTAHIMNKKLDSGKIIDEMKFKINDFETIETLKLKSFFSMNIQFIDILQKIINGDSLKFTKSKWKKKPYTIKQLNRINVLNKTDDLTTKLKKLRSLTYYPHGLFYLKNKKKVKYMIKRKNNII